MSCRQRHTRSNLRGCALGCAPLLHVNQRQRDVRPRARLCDVAVSYTSSRLLGRRGVLVGSAGKSQDGRFRERRELKICLVEGRRVDVCEGLARRHDGGAG